MNHRVLVISPHFPPVHAPDSERIRMALPYMPEFGWDATVLSVRPDEVEAARDILLARTVPLSIPVHRVRAIPVRWTRAFGAGNLALRSLPFLWQAGSRLLRGAFDLVFFSTTQYPVTVLGPWWRRRFGIPYVMDFQDPWWSDYYDRPGAPEPPGGRRKYALSQALARGFEGTVVRGASHIVSVSPAYPTLLRRRYPDVSDSRFTALPFGAPARDFDSAAEWKVTQSIFDPNDGLTHWVYVGRGGADMAVALRAMLTAVARARQADPSRWSALRLHFLGTDYAPERAARKTVEPIARECGLAGIVDEQPGRIPYFQAIACLKDAHALLMPGSDDPAYSASKVYSCILARKPLLAVFHERSSVVDVLRATQAGVVITFSDRSDARRLSEDVERQWFGSACRESPPVDWSAFSVYTAREMTRRLCAVFQKAIQHG
ncbi:MAG TPA: glycosyltransferase [Elusimicrobiota bacterium]|nr:glycosyltransferase [Elusimicrobiota bacterium]